jgi:hypothetical protein
MKASRAQAAAIALPRRDETITTRLRTNRGTATSPFNASTARSRGGPLGNSPPGFSIPTLPADFMAEAAPQSPKSRIGRIGTHRRLGYSSQRGRWEVAMVDSARRVKLQRDFEQPFLPDYDAQSMPSADKRAAYALEHIAFRVGRIEESLAKIAAAIETLLATKP